MMGQATLRVASLGPRVAKIQIQLLDFAGLKPFQQIFCIGANNTYIIQLLILGSLAGIISDIMLGFDTNEGLLRIQLRHTDGEAPLTAANL